jgi:porin
MKHAPNPDRRAAGGLLLLALAAGEASAQDAPARTPGLVPVPRDYADRAHHLAGDLGGRRTAWAEEGLQVEVGYTHVGQGVTSGGRETGWAQGGKLESAWTLDLDRMELLPGALVTMRTESRYGSSVNREAGTLLPVNDVLFFPLTDEPDDDLPVAITELRYTQFLSRELGVFLGKFVTLGGDANEFAGGRGDTQFLGHSFLSASVTAVVNPYCTLGAGVFWMPTEDLFLSTSLYSAADSSTTSGLGDLDEGWVWSSSLRTRHGHDGLPGGMMLTAQYGFGSEFLDFDGSFVGADGLRLPLTDDSWNLFWNGWQYLTVEAGSDERVDVTDGRTDRRGLGVFARAAIADRSTNPVPWVVSGGLGGRGTLPGRADDTWGVGYAVSEVRDEPLVTGLLLDSATQRFEGYYELAFTPSAALTLDAQWADSIYAGVDPATLLGLRLRVQF